jgi:PKD repeat protein
LIFLLPFLRNYKNIRRSIYNTFKYRMTIINNGDKNMKRVIKIWLVAIFLGSLVGTSILPAVDSQHNQINIKPTGVAISNAPYTGRLRIYVVEPVSRWNMYNGQPYHFGFLGFAYNQDISIDPQDTYHNSVTWTGDVTESNAMVMAVVFNSEPHQGYAYPPSSNPFTAYYTDATAAATPGNTGYNTVNETFTHTVFAEEATATWCPYCPDMATKLNNIYESGIYPYYFVALVADKNAQAQTRINEYNTYGYPTAFFDGGLKVIVGSGVSESTYRSDIRYCGTRDVPALNLSVSVAYIGSGDLQIDVAIKNNQAPESLTCDAGGPYTGEINVPVQFTGIASGGTEPYTWAWAFGDGATASVQNPTHTYTTKGNYTVTLTVTDAAAGTATDTATATITQPVLLPVLEIGAITGGFGVKASVKNTGAGAATNVDWTIALDGKLVFVGKSSTGTFTTIAPAGSEAIKAGFILGFGKTNIVVSATCDEGVSAEATASGLVFGPFVLGVK